MFRSRFSGFLASATVLICGSALWAQSAGVVPRVTSPVRETEVTALRGNVPLAVQARYDQGAAQASMPMTHIRLVLSRSAGQQVALDTYLAELQDSASPNYHKWLTPEEFGKLYGPADADIAAIVSWLQSDGLQVEGVSKGRTNIAFSGSVSQVAAALHTQIHSFVVNGEQFYSNTSDPKIPSALAPVVAGVAHLNTIQPKPHLAHGTGAAVNAQTRHMERIKAAGGLAAAPDLTGGSGTASDPYFLLITAADAATIYDTPNSFNAGYNSGTSYTGQGVTIGIGGEALIRAATVADYRSRFLNSSAQVTIINVDGVTSSDNTGAIDEGYLDTEIAGGLAPNASIRFYTSTDLWSAIDEAINANAIDIFNLSFGLCENYLSTADNQELLNEWQQAASQGIAVTVSSGDTGSAGCDAQEDSNGNRTTSAASGIAVSGFASTPYNIAVGGTDFYALSTSFASYVSTSEGSYYRTAKGYIPESSWNDSAQDDELLAQNVPWTAPNASYANISAGSGGPSGCSVNTTVDTQQTYTIGSCTSGYAKPLWQRGTGVPNDGARDIPDVSFMAGNGFNPATWLVCDDDTTTGSLNQAVPMNCTAQSDGYFYVDAWGGTSAASPAFAGMLALVQQKAGGRLGQAAKQLYDLYNGAQANAIFHDITVGNNSVACLSGSPNCVRNTAGYYFESGYDTATGYDLATGLGSVDVTNLVNYWGTAADPIAAGMNITSSARAVSTAQSFTVTAAMTASGGQGVPSGTVMIASGSYKSAAQQLTNGSYTFTVPPGSLSAGSDTLIVNYSGDQTYAVASQGVLVQVSQAIATVNVNPSTSSLNSAAALSVPVTVTGQANGTTPTGTVTLSSGSYTSGAQQLNGSGSFQFVIPAYSLGGGLDTLTVAYSGDASYAVASGSAAVAVTQSKFAISASNVTVKAGAASGNVSNISVTQVAGYTGAITLTTAISSPAGASGIPTLTVGSSPVTLSATTTSGSATVTVGTTAASASGSRRMAGWFGAAGGAMMASLLLFILPGGSKHWRRMLGVGLMAAAVSFAVVGCGGGSSGSAPAKSTPTVTVSPSKTTLTVNDSLGVTVAVTGSGSTPTGSVTLTAGAYSTTQTLSNGSASITIPANTLSTSGTVSLTASYAGDSNFTSASGSASVTVNSAAKATPTVTVTPAKTTISAADSLSVTVAVNGSNSAPTGSVALSGGGYQGLAQTLAGGSTTFTIPASTLMAGSVALTASYGGDSNYNAATGSTTIVVTPAATTTGVYTVTVTGTGNDAAHTQVSTTFTLTVQ